MSGIERSGFHAAERTISPAGGYFGDKTGNALLSEKPGLSLDDLNVIAVMDDAASLIRCITLGMGISILSRATVQNDAQFGKLLIIPLGQSAFLRKLYIVYSSTQFMSEQTAHFFAFMKQFYAIS